MRKIRLLLLISLIISCLFAFASCDDTEELKAPQGIEIEQSTLTLQWKAVQGARLYTISITKAGEEPREAIASKTYYSLTGLTEGLYTIQVKANGKDGVSRDSKWSVSIPFEREKETGMTFTLINGNTEYEVTGKGVATGDIVIPDTYRGLPVTSIGKKAFFNKSDVTSVVIGNNVKSIGDYAFANCSYITSIVIPSGLTSIGESAFASCRLMTGTITIPDGVTTVRKNTFAYCGNIESVVFGNAVTSIEASAFTDCSKLTSITLPDTLESIGTLAFAKCKNVVTLDLGTGLKSIDDYAFSELVSLESVRIPNSTERIGEGAFYLCELLDEVDLGNGIKQISNGAFYKTKLWNKNTGSNEIYVGKWFLGCKDNTVSSVSFRNDTIGIADYALYGNTTIGEIELPDSVTIVGKAAFSKMSITTLILGGGVVEIGDEAFATCKQLDNVILGAFDNKTAGFKYSNLQSIGDYAFRECEVLESIVMPSTLKKIGTYAFRDTGLFKNSSGVVYADKWVVDYNEGLPSNVVIADGTVGIANYAFYNCTVLNSISLPNSVKTVGRAAFYDCSALSEVHLPATLEVIEEYTFYRCKSLNLFDLPAMLTYIGRSAFYKCGTSANATVGDTDSNVLVIPADVTYIGDFAFYNCGYSERAALEDEQYYNVFGIDIIIFGDSVEYIGANAFNGFISLKQVYLGGTQYIGEKAFYKCELLTTVDFGTSLKTIGEKAFYKCTALESVILPESLTDVGNYAFYKCESVTTAQLGGATKIGSFAFYGNTSLADLTIPMSVTTIGKQAFRNCKALTAVIVSPAIEVVEQHAFYGCSSLTIYVAFEKAPETWHKYWNSSYRPVVYNCVLSEDFSYVLYVEKGAITNLNSSTTLSDPIRDGYVFIGWGNNSTTSVPAFTSANLSEAENGKKLYAIWAEEQN